MTYRQIPAPTLRAITVSQPWATLIAAGHKRIETRSWATGHTGRLAIHAGKGLGQDSNGDPVRPDDLNALCATEPIASLLRALDPADLADPDQAAAGRWDLALPRGQVIAIADLLRCTVMTPESVQTLALRNPTEHALGFYEPDRVAWVLQNVRKVPHTTCRGALGIWAVEGPAATALEAADA